MPSTRRLPTSRWMASAASKWPAPPPSGPARGAGCPGCRGRCPRGGGRRSRGIEGERLLEVHAVPPPYRPRSRKRPWPFGSRCARAPRRASSPARVRAAPALPGPRCPARRAPAAPAPPTPRGRPRPRSRRRRAPTARRQAATRLSSSSASARRRLTPPCRSSASIASSVPKRAKYRPCRSSACPLRSGPARLELLRRVLVDAHVHPEVRLLDVVAALLGGDPGAQQALVDQRLHHVHRRGRLRPARKVEHRLGRLEREAALEDRALGEAPPAPTARAAPTTSRSPPGAWPGAPPRRGRPRAAGSGRASARRAARATAPARAPPPARSRAADRRAAARPRPPRRGWRRSATKSGLCARARAAKSSIASLSNGSGSSGKTSSPGEVQPLAAGDDEGGLGAPARASGRAWPARAPRPARSCRG